ncbi:hypothetical protein BD779DRAFT_249796 [Infundibulicybe gibba]|nr:hypothetical protein BD779DRAFT_249796 [Infundibulicybe gibba]
MAMSATTNSQVITTPQAPDEWISYFRGQIGALEAHPSPFDSPPVHCAVFGIPPEILGEIFLHCLPPGKWGSFSASDPLWVLTKVCYSWREVALSMPLLWSKLPPSSLLGWHPAGVFGRDLGGDTGGVVICGYLNFTSRTPRR